MCDVAEVLVGERTGGREWLAGLSDDDTLPAGDGEVTNVVELKAFFDRVNGAMVE